MMGGVSVQIFIATDEIFHLVINIAEGELW